MDQPGGPDLAALERAVRTLIVKNIALIGGHDEQLAEAVRRTQTPTAGLSRVVVVGETKRGKSSLINALLRQPALSPVDLAVATSAFIEFRHGSRLTIRAFVAGSENPEPIEAGQLVDWATALGSRPKEMPPARSIVVECDSPILRNGVVLVDTPGAGSLDKSHGEITLEALRHAVALLFVVDATAEISRPEMEFLRHAAETIDLVLFALTKKDSVPEFESILEGNRERVATDVPRLADAPWFPVDSELARIALAEFGAGVDFDELWAQSRVPQLTAGLQLMVGNRASLLPLANGLRASEVALSEIEGRLVQKVALADPSPEEIESLTRDRQEMARKAGIKKQGVSHDVDVGIRQIRIALNDTIRHEIDELSDSWVKRLDQKTVESSEDLQVSLESDAEALFIRIHLEAAAAVDRLLTEELRSIPTFEDTATRGPDVFSGNREKHVSSPEDAYGNVLERRVALITGVGGGLMIGRTALASVASLVGLASGLVAPLGLALGFGVSHVFHHLRSQQMTKQQQRQWMLTEIGRLRTDVMAALEVFLADAGEALYPVVLETIESLDVEMQEQLAQLDRLRNQDRAERQLRKREAEAERQVVRQRRMDVQNLLHRVQITKLESGTAQAAVT